MDAIGGFFELELFYKDEYHNDAIRLNTGRNAFEYILRSKGYKKVYLPYYTCDVMLLSVNKLNLDFEFYRINNSFYPLFDLEMVEDNAVFVYNNYFGLCNTQVSDVVSKCKNVIIDNSQSFYSRQAQPNVDTFYSARKFFGVPDGAYLYTDKLYNKNLEIDISYLRFKHLLCRVENAPEVAYKFFLQTEIELSNQPIKRMSGLTKLLLGTINYEHVALIRLNNFFYLHNALGSINNLKLDLLSDFVPMIYPFLVRNGGDLKKFLIENDVFVATYWPNVITWINDPESFETELSTNLVCLAIDQRYSEREMKYIIDLIRNFIK